MPLREWKRQEVDHVPAAHDQLAPIWRGNSLIAELKESFKTHDLDYTGYQLLRRGPPFEDKDTDATKAVKISAYQVVLSINLKKVKPQNDWTKAEEEVVAIVRKAAIAESQRQHDIAANAASKALWNESLTRLKEKSFIRVEILEPWMIESNTEINYQSHLPYTHPPQMGAPISDTVSVGTLGGYLELKIQYKHIPQPVLALCAMTNDHIANTMPEGATPPNDSATARKKLWRNVMYSSTFHEEETREKYIAAEKLALKGEPLLDTKGKFKAAREKLCEGENRGWGKDHKMYHGCWDVVWDEVLDAYESNTDDNLKDLAFINALEKYFGRSCLTGSGAIRQPKKQRQCKKWRAFQQVMLLGKILLMAEESRKNAILAQSPSRTNLRLGVCQIASGEDYLPLGPAVSGKIDVEGLDWAMIEIDAALAEARFTHRRLNISKDLLELVNDDYPECPLAKGEPLKFGTLKADDVVYKVGARTGATKGKVMTLDWQNDSPQRSWYDEGTMNAKRTQVRAAKIGNYEPFQPSQEIARVHDQRYWMFAFRGDSGAWVVNRNAEVVGMLDSGRDRNVESPVHVTDMGRILKNIKETYVTSWNKVAPIHQQIQVSDIDLSIVP